LEIVRSALVFNNPTFIACYSLPPSHFLTAMTSVKRSERNDELSQLEDNHRSTATYLDKIRNLESEKRTKLTTAQDELDATQEMLDGNSTEETRTASGKKTEERLLNMVKIQTGSLERAAAAWQLRQKRNSDLG
jgi:hypothetical protein